MKYIAVDIGKRDCKACIMNSDGSIAEETKYNNTLYEAEILVQNFLVLLRSDCRIFLEFQNQPSEVSSH